MQATWSQPPADLVVFSNDFASRRDRPRRPWATSTRQACRMGRKTGCLSSHPTRRTSRSWPRPSSSRGDPTVHQDHLEPAGDALLDEALQHQLGCPVCVEAGTASAPTGSPVTSTATMRLAPLMRRKGRLGRGR